MKSLWRNDPLRAWLGVGIFFVAVSLFWVAHIPLQTQQQVITTRPVAFVRPSEWNTAAAQPRSGSIDYRRLEIGWPEKISKDEKGWVRLTIHAPQAGNPAGATASQSLPEIDRGGNFVANARFEMPGWSASQAEYKQPLRPGQPVTFRWPVQRAAEGLYPGTLWLHLEFVPQGGGPVEETLLLSRPIRIRTVSLGGLSRGQVQKLGAAGLGLSLVCVYPWLRKRLPLNRSGSVRPARQAVRSESQDL